MTDAGGVEVELKLVLSLIEEFEKFRLMYVIKAHET